MAKDLTGQRFGRLTAMERSGKDQWQNILWRCRCDCGNETVVRGGNLIAGAVVSCGCVKKYNAITHGGSKTRLYRIWHGIIRRTEDSRRKEYANYGGYGIRICQDWHESFEVFRSWAIKNGYNDDLSICRRDKTADYSPENCFWGTTAELRKTGYAHRKRTNKPSEPG